LRALGVGRGDDRVGGQLPQARVLADRLLAVPPADDDVVARAAAVEGGGPEVVCAILIALVAGVDRAVVPEPQLAQRREVLAVVLEERGAEPEEVRGGHPYPLGG